MKFDAEKWSLFERAHDYRFLLRLLGFALVADLLLVFGLGTNLWAISWEEVGSRPGILLGAVLAYGAVMTVGSTVVSWAATDVFNLLVPTLQRWLGSHSRPTADSRRYVRWSDAQTWLDQQTDATRRAPVERQMTDLQEERSRWLSVVSAGWAGVALVIASLAVPGSGVAVLGEAQWWIPWAILFLPAMPCAYHVWNGPPGHGQIELPQLAEALHRQRFAPNSARTGSND